MNEGSSMINKILVVLASVFAFFFGDDPVSLKFVYALIIMQGFDILTGLFAMMYQREKFDYRFFFEGFMKKVMMLVAVSFGYFIDQYEILGSNIEVSFQTSIASAFIMVEVFSNLANFKKVGLSLPFIEKYIKLD